MHLIISTKPGILTFYKALGTKMEVKAIVNAGARHELNSYPQRTVLFQHRNIKKGRWCS
jgi:hypothetical protein